MNDQEETPSIQTHAAPVATVETFKCNKCDREFSKAQALQTHITRAHTKFWSTTPGLAASRGPGRTAKHKRGAKVCPVCKKRFAKFYLPQHMRTQHGQSLREYRRREDALALRIRNGQTTPATPALRGRPRGTGNKKCPVCKKNFSARPNMTLHLRKVHGKSILEFEERGGHQPMEPAPERVPTGETQRVIGAAQKGYEVGRRERAKPEGREVVFCPVCGTNIHAVRTAVNFADQ